MRKAVLWGHHTEEYQAMFDLSTADLQRSILEYGSGTSAFNGEMNSPRVTSCDPWFNLDKEKLSEKAHALFGVVAERLKQGLDCIDLTHYGTLDHLLALRREGMATFFADYEKGQAQQRYLPVEGITLPFKDFSFDLAISSHYLFVGLMREKVDFHVHVITELARVAKEVRIFPLIDADMNPSPLLGSVLLSLQQGNYGVELREVDYHEHPTGNAMLRVWAQQCNLSD